MHVDPTKDPRWLGQPPISPEEAAADAADLEQRLTGLDQVARAFVEESWPALRDLLGAWAQRGRDALVIRGVHDPQKDAETRGWVNALQDVLDLPDRVDVERRRLNEELRAIQDGAREGSES